MQTAPACTKHKRASCLFKDLAGPNKLKTAQRSFRALVNGRSALEVSLRSACECLHIQANINGRVLCQCNLDELRKEMNMNFGDWHLFKAMVRFVIHSFESYFYPKLIVAYLLVYLSLVQNVEGLVCIVASFNAS